MNGLICLVTGSTHGIGLATARALAERRATVLIHGRDLARARAAADMIGRATGNRDVRAVQADFAELRQVRRLAEQLAANLPRLDVLINNAGVMARRGARSADGYDLTFAVNHLAPFLLTNLLLDKLKQSAPSRIVVVASEAHRRAELDFGDLMNANVSRFLTAYERSKLANLLFVRSLARRLAGSGVSVHALHPGLVASRLFHDLPLPLRWLLLGPGRLFMISPERGSRGAVYLASPGRDAESGGYYKGCARAVPSAAARSDESAERLWAQSARLTGLAP